MWMLIYFRNIGMGMGSTSARIGGMFAPYSSLLVGTYSR